MAHYPTLMDANGAMMISRATHTLLDIDPLKRCPKTETWPTGAMMITLATRTPWREIKNYRVTIFLPFRHAKTIAFLNSPN